MADAMDKSDADCSDDFYMLASEEAPDVGDDPGPYLIVTSPAEEGFAGAGEMYTVKVRSVEAEGLGLGFIFEWGRRGRGWRSCFMFAVRFFALVIGVDREWGGGGRVGYMCGWRR